QFAKKGNALRKNDGPNDVETGNDFAHSEERATCARGIGAETEEADLVQGDGLRVEMENRALQRDILECAWIGRAAFRGLFLQRRREDGPQIDAGAPGAVVGTNRVEVEAVAGVFGVALIDEGQAGTEAVLRRNAADSDVHRMVGEE